MAERDRRREEILQDVAQVRQVADRVIAALDQELSESVPTPSILRGTPSLEALDAELVGLRAQRSELAEQERDLQEHSRLAGHELDSRTVHQLREDRVALREERERLDVTIAELADLRREIERAAS